MSENKQIKAKIREILNKILPDIDINSATELVDDGLLDSLSIIMIISELSMTYDITFDYDELTSEQMNSLDSISQLVEYRIKKKRK